MQEEFLDCEKSQVPDLAKSTHPSLRVSFVENKNVRYVLHKTPNDNQQMSLDDDVLELSSCLTLTLSQRRPARNNGHEPATSTEFKHSSSG